jgi:MinD-like ATPase involved in chromosome partitioning or flagellar assembly
VLDTDLQSPGAHVLFGFEPEDIRVTLVDFLWGKCEIRETAYEISEKVGAAEGGGAWLVPAALTTEAITRIVDEGYDVNRLNEHFDDLLQVLDLDYLLIDTHPGLNRETMLTTALSDVLVLILRPDQQDYYGTAVLTEVAGKMEIPRILLVANKVLTHIQEESFKAQVEEAFGYELIGQLPLSEDWARVESRALFTRVHPEHPISYMLRSITDRIIEP